MEENLLTYTSSCMLPVVSSAGGNACCTAVAGAVVVAFSPAKAATLLNNTHTANNLVFILSDLNGDVLI